MSRIDAAIWRAPCELEQHIPFPSRLLQSSELLADQTRKIAFYHHHCYLASFLETKPEYSFFIVITAIWRAPRRLDKNILLSPSPLLSGEPFAEQVSRALYPQSPFSDRSVVVANFIWQFIQHVAIVIVPNPTCLQISRRPILRLASVPRFLFQIIKGSCSLIENKTRIVSCYDQVSGIFKSRAFFTTVCGRTYLGLYDRLTDRIPGARAVPSRTRSRQLDNGGLVLLIE